MTKELFYYLNGVINFNPEYRIKFNAIKYYDFFYFKLSKIGETKKKVSTLISISQKLNKDMKFVKTTYDLINEKKAIYSLNVNDIITKQIYYCFLIFELRLRGSEDYDWINCLNIQFTEDEIHIGILGNFHKEFFYYNPETMLPDNNFKVPNPYWKENKALVDNFLSAIKEGFKEYGIREMTEEEALS